MVEKRFDEVLGAIKVEIDTVLLLSMYVDVEVTIVLVVHLIIEHVELLNVVVLVFDNFLVIVGEAIVLMVMQDDNDLT